MSDAVVAARFLDGFELAFVFVLIGIAARSMVATTGFVLGRRAAHQDIALILCVVAMIIASTLVAERFLVVRIDGSASIRLIMWLTAPLVIVASLVLWELSATGRVWQALLADAGTLWEIGYDAEKAACRALFLAFVLVFWAGFVLAGKPTPSLAVWAGLGAAILLLINRGPLVMSLMLLLLGAVFGAGAVLFDQWAGVAAGTACVLAVAVWQGGAGASSAGAPTS